MLHCGCIRDGNTTGSPVLLQSEGDLRPEKDDTYVNSSSHAWKPIQLVPHVCRKIYDQTQEYDQLAEMQRLKHRLGLINARKREACSTSALYIVIHSSAHEYALMHQGSAALA